MYTPYAPPGKGLAPAGIRPECWVDALGIIRSFSRIVEDSARVETPLLRVFGARYGYLAKYNLPLSKAVVSPLNPKVTPPASAQPPRASKPDGMVSVWTKALSSPGCEGKYLSRGTPRSPRTRLSETPWHGAKSDDPRRRSRSRSCGRVCGDPGRVVDKKTRDARLIAWGAGVNGKGSLRDLRKNCYLGTGAHVPEPQDSRQD